MKDCVYFDSHVHISNDKAYDYFIDASRLDEILKDKFLDGCLAVIHSTDENYEKDCSKIKKYCKKYSNIIPCVELAQKFIFNNSEIKCHVMYLADMPIYDDISYGSWFCHVKKKGGLFFSYDFRNNYVSEALICNPKNGNKSKVNIVESTTDCEEAIFLKSLNLTVLLGTDIHPNKNKKYASYLGSRGTIIKSDKFNYNTFMQALQENSFGYFSKTVKANELITCSSKLKK
ncbi:MAG: hypothetical protein WC376_00570 [Candidatus Nanoarchaeia archaeon]|jgi:hypothetical protein